MGDPVIGTAQETKWRSLVEHEGFAIIPALLTSHELIPTFVALGDLVPLRSRAGVRHVLSHPAVNVIAHDPRLLGMAQQVLGPQAFPFRATFFDKSPDSNWLITWHQDTALPLKEKIETPGWGRGR